MNPNLILDILELAVSLAETQAGKKVQQDATLAGLILQIIAKAVQAYEEHTGQPLDPSLVRPEEA